MGVIGEVDHYKFINTHSTDRYMVALQSAVELIIGHGVGGVEGESTMLRGAGLA